MHQCSNVRMLLDFGSLGPLPGGYDVVGADTADGSFAVVAGYLSCPLWVVPGGTTTLTGFSDGDCEVLQSVAGNDLDPCAILTPLSGSSLLCQEPDVDLAVPYLLQVTTLAAGATLTAVPLLPSNTNNNALFWPNPASGIILFLSTPSGGTQRLSTPQTSASQVPNRLLSAPLPRPP